MSDCCAQTVARNASPVAAQANCPTCRASGKPVDILTVKALLRETALARVARVPYRFCASASCEVVYFAGAAEMFLTADVRVEVWQKLPFGRRTVCYCFGENEAAMRNEVERTGSSAAVTRVRDHIAAARCACEVRNPQGVCCLGEVTQAVKRVMAAARTAASTGTFDVVVGKEVAG